MSVTTEAIVKNHLHVGSLTNETNPKTRKYQLTTDSGLTIINPDLIKEQLENAKKKVQDMKKEKKQILVVCEKTMYSEEVASICEKGGYHYLNQKLPAGFLTNFPTLIQRIDSMNEKKKFVLSDSYERLTKKEKVSIKRNLAKVERIYEGVKALKNKPDLVIVVDGFLTSGLIAELELSGIDSIVLASTNFNKWWNHDSLVMMNMQSYQALDFALHYILD